MPKPVHYHLKGFPPQAIQWEALIPLIGPANATLARYDGMLAAIPNPSVLLTPLFTQEAVLSSRIEGTQATMGDVYEYQAVDQPTRFSEERRADIQEILNYRQAMITAEQMLRTLPLCQRVMKEAHRVLMAGVRGQNKAPGEYRKGPNWIGPPGCTVDDATFVPISADKLPAAMDAWEKFIHFEAPDRLTQLAVLHAEFEALHPFLDGNGRLGRMFIPLFLHSARLLQSPMFYISAYLEAHRDAYYERLLAISRDGDWTGWCRFFLEALARQAEANLAKTQAILELYNQKKERILQLTHSRFVLRTLDFLFTQPIFSSPVFVQKAGIPERTAKRILTALRSEGFFRVIQEASGRRPAILAFRKLLNAAEGREVF